jgi:hypothetical protein
MTAEGYKAWLDPKDFAMILEDLQERGFALPFHVAAVGVNGAILAGDISEDATRSHLDFAVTAEHYPDDRGFECPMNMMFVDSKGEAARVVLGRLERPEIFYLN